MAQFDPNRPPMSLSESEELLNGRSGDAEVFSFWFGFFKGIAKLIALCGAIALVTWLCIAVPVVGWIVGVIVFIFAMGQIAQAGNKK